MILKDSSFTVKYVDHSHLIEFAGGDGVLISKYIILFLNSTRPMLSNMRDAVIKSRPDLLYKALHTLVPQLKFMGIILILPEAEATMSRIQQAGNVSEETERNIYKIIECVEQAMGELELWKIKK